MSTNIIMTSSQPWITRLRLPNCGENDEGGIKRWTTGDTGTVIEDCEHFGDAIALYINAINVITLL